MSETLKTNVSGYYNPNTWPIHVAISGSNIGVTLQPNEFILDRVTGKKINDPVLEDYCGPRMLARETASAAVDVIQLPKITAIKISGSGYVVGQGQRDSTGKWQPPSDSNQPGNPAEIPASNRASVHAMSVDDARRLGLIGKPRLIPEDFGAPDSEGAPQRGDNIPNIRYSLESKPKYAPGELPPEITQAVRPEMQGIVHGLSAGASQSFEAPDLSTKAAESAVQEQQGETGAQQFMEQKVARRVAQVQAPPMLAQTNAQTNAQTDAQTEAQAPKAAPQPGQTRVAQPAQPAESPLMGGPGKLPQPDLESPVSREEAREYGGKPTIVCGACGQSFKYPSWYKRHVQNQHKDRIKELLGDEA